MDAIFIITNDLCYLEYLYASIIDLFVDLEGKDIYVYLFVCVNL